MKKILFLLLISIKCFSQSEYEYFKKEVIYKFDNVQTTQADGMISVKLSKNNEKGDRIFIFGKKTEKLHAIFYEFISTKTEADMVFNEWSSNDEYHGEYAESEGNKYYYGRDKNIIQFKDNEKGTYTVIIKFLKH